MLESKQARLLGDGKNKQMGNSYTYGKQLLDLLHGQMLNQSDYCDVTVTCCDTDIKAHWCVLAGAPYFQSLYNSGLQEKQQDRVHIRVGSVHAVQTVLTFLYTGSVSLDSTMFEEVVELADYLQVDGLKKLCTDFLRYYVPTNVDNCIQMYSISDLYNLENKSFLLSYIKERLDSVIRSKSALEMTPDLIRILMEDPVLSFVSREDFFKFLHNWVNEDLEGRREHFCDLFCSMDLDKMGLEFLKHDVKSSPVVTSSDLCMAKCKATFDKFSSGELCSDGKTDVIIVTGGMTGNILKQRRVFGYVVSENRWIELPNIPFKDVPTCVTLAFNPSKNCLFVCDQIKTDQMCKFEFNKRTWSKSKSTIKLPPTKVTSKSIDLLVGSILIMEKGHKSYIVANGVPEKGKSKVPDHNVYLLEANEELTGYQKCSVVYRSRRKINITAACVARDRYICIMLVDGYAQHKTKVFLKEASRKMLVEITKQESLQGTGSTMFAIHKKLFLTHRVDINKVLHSVYDLHLRKWTTVNCEKPLFTWPANEHFGYATCKDRLYIFGSQKREGNVLKMPTDSSLSVDVANGKSEDIANLPTALMNCSALHVRVPQEYVRCHINCPHCKALRENDNYSESESEDDCEEVNSCNCGMCRPYFQSSSDDNNCSIMWGKCGMLIEAGVLGVRRWFETDVWTLVEGIVSG